jgi:general secretion pathway protein C
MSYAKADQPLSKSALWVLTFCAWAVLCYSAVYWGFKWLANRQDGVPVSSVGRLSEDMQAPTLGELRAALGDAPGPQVAPLSAQELQAQQLSLLSSRVHLLGVVSSQGSQHGAALLSLDQQAAKPYKVGDEVEPGLFLLALAPKGVQLGPSPTGPVTLVLNLPAFKGI